MDVASGLGCTCGLYAEWPRGDVELSPLRQAKEATKKKKLAVAVAAASPNRRSIYADSRLAEMKVSLPESRQDSFTNYITLLRGNSDI